VPISVTELFRYPVKSCRGERLTRAAVEPWGLAGDRRFMLVDDDGNAVTARDRPRLLLVNAVIAGNHLRLSAPGIEPLTVPVPVPVRPRGTAQARPARQPSDANEPWQDHQPEMIAVRIWRSKLDAALAAPTAHAWFSAVAGVSVRLVYLDDPTRRAMDPAHSRPSDRVSFADGYPLLLASESSLAAVDAWIATGPHAEEGPVPMRRFRPSVVVAGAPAWAEDGWRRIRVGETFFRVARSCDRCVMTRLDPDTARMGHEPMSSLARHRRWDDKLWFAVNLIPEGPGALAIGDEVQIIDSGPAFEPLR